VTFTVNPSCSDRPCLHCQKSTLEKTQNGLVAAAANPKPAADSRYDFRVSSEPNPDLELQLALEQPDEDYP